ncbi:MAG: hypothetical protein ACKOX6_09200 [Bdellovibrio sp.]
MYLGQNKRYKFFSEEVNHCPQLKLQRIAEGCKKVEDAVWNAHEDFYSYLQKQSAVFYAKCGDQIVAFALFDLYVQDETLVVAANECMVLPEHQGFKLPNIFSSILTTHFRRDSRFRKLRRKFHSVTFVSTTVNYKMMEAFRRYSYLGNNSSFKPDSEILEVAEQYRRKENLELLNGDSSFFIKGAFPNSSKNPPTLKAPGYVPKDFDLGRGDCFLFVCRIHRFWLLGFMAKITRWQQGFKFSKRIIPIARMYREHTIYTR